MCWETTMKALLITLFVCDLFVYAAPALANNKPQYTYQAGILQGFRRGQSGSNCIEGTNASGTVSTSLDSFGSTGGKAFANAAGASSCDENYSVVYIVKSGGATYALTPRGDSDESKGGLLIRALIPHSVLDHQPPQTPIEIRSDGRHFFVKIGDRESVYSAAREE
jgi:hypothetical protein